MKSLDKKKAKELECNCIMSGYAQTTNFCPVHKNLSMKPKELDWEKEFDNDCWDTKDGVMTVTYLMKGGNKVGKLTERVTKEMIKSYVKILLTQQRTELLEEIPKKIKGKNKEFVEGYNNAIDDISNLLNKKDE